MKRYPNGSLRVLGVQTQPRMRNHDIVCFHTMVGNLSGTDDYFRRGGFSGTESHYGVGGRWGLDASRGLDGRVYQWQERSHTADANYEGNWHVISVETADNAPKRASDIAPWTASQLAALVELTVWECSLAAHADCPEGWRCRTGSLWKGVRVAIPPVAIKNTRPGERGLAVHRQGVKHSQGFGVAGFLVSGGEKWSVSDGKECPGDARARQFHDELIPRVQARLLKGTTKKAGFMIEKADKETLRAMLVDVLKTEAIVPNKPTTADLAKDPKARTESYFSVVSALANLETDDDNFRAEVRQRLAAQDTKLAEILSLLKPSK